MSKKQKTFPKNVVHQPSFGCRSKSLMMMIAVVVVNFNSCMIILARKYPVLLAKYTMCQFIKWPFICYTNISHFNSSIFSSSMIVSSEKIKYRQNETNKIKITRIPDIIFNWIIASRLNNFGWKFFSSVWLFLFFFVHFQFQKKKL